MKNKKNHQDSQDKKSPTLRERLRDYKKSGKLRPWKKRRNLCEGLGKKLIIIPGFEKIGERMLKCCTYTEFDECEEALHGKKLVSASFCKCRICPNCQSRSATKLREEVFNVASAHLEQHPDHVAIFLTTTTPNVQGELLGQEIDKLNAGSKRMFHRKIVKDMNEAHFKALEITFNPTRMDFHPHFHIMMMVRPEYFNPNSPLYITHAQWLKIWQEAMRDPTITQVNIQVIKDKGEGTLAAIVAEVAKYTTKPGSYVVENKNGEVEVNEFAACVILNALHNRRTIGFGGNFRTIRKALNKEKKARAEELKAAEKAAEKEEQLNEDGIQQEKPTTLCKDCHKPMTRVSYLWDPILKDYFKAPPQEMTPNLTEVHCRGP